MTLETNHTKSLGQQLWDLVGAPMRLLFLPDELVRRAGWTTKGKERLHAVLPLVRGRLLDIGAGENHLVRLYGDGVGVDVHDWGGGAHIVDDVTRLPFPDESFDTVTFLACLNHIPEREEALREAFRLLTAGGQVLITMIHPRLGAIGHRFWWYGGRPHRLEEGEPGGLTSREVWAACLVANLEPTGRERFVYGLNSLYRAVKPQHEPGVWALESETASRNGGVVDTGRTSMPSFVRRWRSPR